MDHVLGRMSENSGCMSFGRVWITDLDFTNDAVIIAETIEVLSLSEFYLSREKAKPLKLRVPWIKTKVQAFGDILDATMESL